MRINYYSVIIVTRVITLTASRYDSLIKMKIQEKTPNNIILKNEPTK